MAKTRANRKSPKILVDHVSGDEPLPSNILHVPPRLPDASVRLDRQPRVSAAPEDVAAIRRHWEAHLDEQIAAALAAVCQDDYLFLDVRYALEQRREQAITSLKDLLAEKRRGADKLRVAAVLCDLGDPVGEQFLLDTLRSRSPALRTSALEKLREWDRKVDLTTPQRAQLVLAQLDHENSEVVEAAVDLCVWKAVPGAESRIAALLRNGAPENPEGIALELARITTTAETVQTLLPFLFHSEPTDYYQGYHFSLSRLLCHPDPSIREPIRQALHAHARKLTSRLRHQQHVVYDLAETAEADAIPILEKIRDTAKDPVSRLYALKALARLQPNKAVDLVLNFLSRDGRYEMAIVILCDHATPKDARRIIAAVVPPASRKAPEARQLCSSVVRLLLERLGEQGRRLIAGRLDDVEANARMEAVWALRGLTLPLALADLHAAGILAEPPETVLAQLEVRSDEEDDPTPQRGPVGVLRALGLAGLTTGFDTETGMLPCDHDRLMVQFGQGTAGRFVPECPVQVWHKQDEEDYHAPYTLAFLYLGRAYVFGAENYGDYYDVEAVVGALNFALEQEGQPERFLGVAGGGQCAEYVFADPNVFLPLAEKYGIPVSADHNGPMRAGRAFEESASQHYPEEDN